MAHGHDFRWIGPREHESYDQDVAYMHKIENIQLMGIPPHSSVFEGFVPPP